MSFGVGQSEAHLRVVGVTRLWPSANLLWLHPVTLYWGVMCSEVKAQQQGRQRFSLYSHSNTMLIHVHISQVVYLWKLIKVIRVICAAAVRLSRTSKDISDFSGLQGERPVLSGAVAVGLNHKHQKVALWYLLHHKHPETHKCKNKHRDKTER